MDCGSLKGGRSSTGKCEGLKTLNASIGSLVGSALRHRYRCPLLLTNYEVEAIILISLAKQQSMRYLVTRVRHVLEAITVDASSEEDALALARSAKRSDWSHVDSKRRRAYKAEKVDINHPGRNR